MLQFSKGDGFLVFAFCSALFALSFVSLFHGVIILFQYRMTTIIYGLL